MQQFSYPIKLTPDKVDGGYVVTCRDLPEAITQGDTIPECIEAAEGALQAAIEARIERGMTIPFSSPAKKSEYFATVPLITALKAATYLSVKESGMSKSELARMLGMDEKEIRRVLDPHHSTKVSTFEQVLHALGKRVSVTII
jgi:antitoxin HicB